MLPMGIAISPRGDMPKHRIRTKHSRMHHVVIQHYLG
ncbi:MAG: hypothetical protein K0R61_4122 [Microvirga sp.]|nr:hypothetical protein [Microvirga sp.]